jgi:hypothetical protein
MAKTVRRKRPAPTISLGVIAGLAPLAITSVEAFQQMGLRGVPHNVVMKLTGYDYWENKFSSTQLMQGVGPIFAGYGAHWLASKLGINRMIARSGIPFIRI